jgi:hypothetical protein
MEHGEGSLLSRIWGTHFPLVMFHNANGSTALAAEVIRQPTIQSHFSLHIIFKETYYYWSVGAGWPRPGDRSIPTPTK